MEAWFPSGTPQSGPSLGIASSYTVSPKARSAPRAWPSNEMFALIGESEPFTLVNNSLTCGFHGRVNYTGRVRRAFDNA